MMKCNYCGADNPDDSKFCFHCGKEFSPKDNDTSSGFEDSVIKFGKALADNSEASTRNDTVCPFCKEPDCEFTQKNTATVTNKNFRWGSGCCGLLMLGPFGLLCGLCGTGSKTEMTSELWWVCKKCGKQHIALADAMKKWEMATAAIWGSVISAAFLFIILRWYLEWGVLSYFTVPIPAMALLGLHNEISEELGEPLIHFLSSEEKKHILIVIIIASLLVIGIGILAFPILGALLSD